MNIPADHSFAHIETSTFPNAKLYNLAEKVIENQTDDNIFAFAKELFSKGLEIDRPIKDRLISKFEGAAKRDSRVHDLVQFLKKSESYSSTEFNNFKEKIFSATHHEAASTSSVADLVLPSSKTLPKPSTRSLPSASVITDPRREEAKESRPAGSLPSLLSASIVIDSRSEEEIKTTLNNVVSVAGRITDYFSLYDIEPFPRGSITDVLEGDSAATVRRGMSSVNTQANILAHGTHYVSVGAKAMGATHMAAAFGSASAFAAGAAATAGIGAAVIGGLMVLDAISEKIGDSILSQPPTVQAVRAYQDMQRAMLQSGQQIAYKAGRRTERPQRLEEITLSRSLEEERILQTVNKVMGVLTAEGKPPMTQEQNMQEREKVTREVTRQLYPGRDGEVTFVKLYPDRGYSDISTIKHFGPLYQDSKVFHTVNNTLRLTNTRDMTPEQLLTARRNATLLIAEDLYPSRDPEKIFKTISEWW